MGAFDITTFPTQKPVATTLLAEGCSGRWKCGVKLSMVAFAKASKQKKSCSTSADRAASTAAQSTLVLIAELFL